MDTISMHLPEEEQHTSFDASMNVAAIMLARSLLRCDGDSQMDEVLCATNAMMDLAERADRQGATPTETIQAVMGLVCKHAKSLPVRNFFSPDAFNAPLVQQRLQVARECISTRALRLSRL